MKRLLIALAVALLAATRPPKAKMVGDQCVLPGPAFAASPMLEVRNIRFYDCRLEETGSKCTVIAGELWNLLDWEEFAVDIEIDLYRGPKGVAKVATVTAHVERPGSKVPVWFSCLAPPCYDAPSWKVSWRAYHLVRLTMVPAK